MTNCCFPCNQIYKHLIALCLVFVCPLAFWRDGVDAAFAERVAAQNAPCAKQNALDNPVNLYCFNHIAGAGGVKSAAVTQCRRDKFLIKPYRQYKNLFNHFR